MSAGTARRTIQSAVNDSLAGEDIFVAPGIYESVTTSNKAVRILATGEIGSTVIDGDSEESCVTVATSDNSSSMATNTVLRGFVLRNGYASSGNGGGALGGTLQCCVISNCVARRNGGGASYSVLENCLITGNSTSDSYGYGGGAHQCYLYGCTVVGNKTGNYGYGGGTYYGYIYNSIIWGNTARSGMDTYSPRLYSNCCVSNTTTYGISANPKFRNPSAGDYRLAEDSPCINAGSNANSRGDKDLDGSYRLALGQVDIGAYEWHPDTREIMVSFNTNGGKGYMQETVFWVDYEANLPANKFTRYGYVFAGWATELEGAIVYTDCQNVVFGDDAPGTINLYAVWTREITVSFDANGGEGEMPSVVGGDGVEFALPYGMFTRIGKSFDGWSITPGGRVAYADGANVTFSEDIVLYAVWGDGPLMTIENGILTAVDLNGKDSVTIPGYVTGIGTNVFYRRTSLRAVTIPPSVKSISAYAFYGCTGLTNLSLSAGVESIGGYAFYNCSSIGDIIIPDSITSIGSYAFEYCRGATNLVIGSGVSSIAWGAFQYCSGLERIYLGRNVQYIQTHAFSNCSALKAFEVDDNNTWYRAVDGILYNKSMTTLRLCPATFTSVHVPNGVDTIGSFAFYGCDSLTYVDLPSGLVNLYDRAFINCRSLKELVVPHTVAYVSEYAFSGDTSLEALYLPSSLEGNIPENAFNNVPSNAIIYYEGALARISFDANGGSGSMGGQWAVPGYSHSLCSNVFAKAGFAFAGWMTEPDGAVVYADGASMTISKDTTLYAKWLTAASVTFNFNGTDEEPVVRFVLPGNTVGELPELRRKGYVGQGWWTLPEGGEQISSATPITGKVTFYAHWKTIPFDYFGGDAVWVESEDGSWRSGEIGDNQKSWAQKSFSGLASISFRWKVSSEARYDKLFLYVDDVAVTNISGTVDWHTVVFDIEDEAEHVFKWVYEKDGSQNSGSDCGWISAVERIPAYFVTFNANGGNGEMPRQAIFGGRMTALSSNVFARADCMFAGWATQADGAVIYEDGADITLDSDIALYAVWRRNICVTFDSNGGDGEMDIACGGEGVAMHLPNCAFTRSGYSFVGWAISSVGNVVYADGVSATFNANTTLYAVWEKLPFDFDGYASWVKESDGCWRSGNINDDEYSSAIMSVNGSGTLEFKWKTSCEDYDALEFYIDDNIETSISGISGTWSSKTYKVDGTKAHEFTWKYVKDESDSDGSDCGWIKDVVWTPDAPTEPVIEGDDGATVTGDPESGFTIKPSEENKYVVVAIPEGVDPKNVTVEVSVMVETITANGATVKVMKGGHDIAEHLDLTAVTTQNGVINLAAAKVKEEVVKETLDTKKGATIALTNAESPTLETAETKPGLTYTLQEGATLEAMMSCKDGDSKIGDGKKWTPKITIKGGKSGFYTIKVEK